MNKIIVSRNFIRERPKKIILTIYLLADNHYFELWKKVWRLHGKKDD